MVLRALTILIATGLAVCGGFLCLWGGYVAAKVFADYKDGADTTYLLVGSLLFFPGLVMLLGSVIVWREGRQLTSEVR